jgi:hypothetical protein
MSDTLAAGGMGCYSSGSAKDDQRPLGEGFEALFTGVRVAGRGEL